MNLSNEMQKAAHMLSVNKLQAILDLTLRQNETS